MEEIDESVKSFTRQNSDPLSYLKTVLDLEYQGKKFIFVFPVLPFIMVKLWLKIKIVH